MFENIFKFKYFFSWFLCVFVDFTIYQSYFWLLLSIKAITNCNVEVKTCLEILFLLIPVVCKWSYSQYIIWPVILKFLRPLNNFEYGTMSFVFLKLKLYVMLVELLASCRKCVLSFVNLLSANPTKWSNTLKWMCLTILWNWHLKG